jgi:nucleoside-diphosphate-sugar epimerase
LNDAYDIRLKEWRLSRIESKENFDFRAGDVTDHQFLGDIFGDGAFDCVINLAARAGVRQSVEDPTAYYETNVLGNLNLLELCKTAGVKKFVLASTSSVYGDSQGPYREDSPSDRPLSPYAASKKAAEVASYTYHSLHGLDAAVLRFFTVYGPAGRPDMSIFRFIDRISAGVPITVFGDGTQERDFTFVSDVARGVVAALDLTGFNVINLGSDRPIVLNDVIRMIEQSLDKTALIEHEPRHPADVTSTWADISTAKEKLDWKPEVNFEEGLAKAVDWYMENKDWATSLVQGAGR